MGAWEQLHTRLLALLDDPDHGFASRYGLAVLAPLVALGFKLSLRALDPGLGEASFALFVSAVMVSAWYGGMRPGLLTLVLGALLGDYFFLPPIYGLYPVSLGTWLQITLFLADGLLVILLMHLLRRTLSGALSARRRAEHAESQAQESLALLQSAMREAEQAHQLKTTFFSRISHEVRTPLSAIIGFAQLLEHELVDLAQRGIIQQLLKAGRHLQALINDILDTTRIEAGQLTMIVEPVRLDEVVQEVIALLEPVAAQRQISLVLPHDEAPWVVLADRRRLAQVLLNLLSNGLKYNHEQGTVSVSYEPQPESLRISVTDSGPGIDPAALSKLFLPFERLGAEHSQIEGTGLGLSLSKTMVEAMGGTIGVDSVPGAGSTFWVTLPLVQEAISAPMSPPAPLADAAVAAPPRRTILHIEDNLALSGIVQRFLSRQRGLHVLSALTGARGLELARHEQPDIILLDMQLPDMAGDEVLRQLRAQLSTQRIPVIVLSAQPLPEQEELILAQGAQRYLTKPFDLTLLSAVLDEVLRSTYG